MSSSAPIQTCLATPSFAKVSLHCPALKGATGGEGLARARARRNRMARPMAGCLRHEWLEGDGLSCGAASAIRRRTTISRMTLICVPKPRRRRRAPLIYFIPVLSSDAWRATLNQSTGRASSSATSGSDKILVMDEATRAKLMQARRQALMAMPGPERLNRPTVGQMMCNVAQLAAQSSHSRPTLDKTVTQRWALIHRRQPIALAGSGGPAARHRITTKVLRRRTAAFIIDPACWRLGLPLACSSSCRRSGRFRRLLR